MNPNPAPMPSTDDFADPLGEVAVPHIAGEVAQTVRGFREAFGGLEDVPPD